MPPVLPPPLRRGDPVVVIAPSSAPRDVPAYERGLEVLRQRYDVQVLYGPEEAASPHGYLSATDDRRLADLHAALADPEARAVFVARGGYGAMRLLDRLNLRKTAVSPKWVVGYSDLTALQMHLYRHLGWASLSGPVVTEWANLSEDTVAETTPRGGTGRPVPYSPNQGRLPDPADPSAPPDLDADDAFHRVAARDASAPLELARGLSVLTSGDNASGTDSSRENASDDNASGDNASGDSPSATTTANGPLLGGNLSVLTRLIGTATVPDLFGAILVIEDVGEPPYRVDRMLTHLHLSGHLDGLAGVVLGSFRPGDIRPPSLSMADVFRDRFSGRPYPVATGLAYGHLFPRLTLPLGAPARLTLNEHTAALHVTLHRPSA